MAAVTKKSNNKSPAIIYWILGSVFGILFLFIGLLIMFPSFTDGFNGPRITEQNFQTALVQVAPITVKGVFPSEMTVVYKTVDGKEDSRVVNVYAIGAEPDGGKYVLYYYPTDNTKQLPIRKAQIVPEKPHVASNPWFADGVKTVFNWSVEKIKSVPYGKIADYLGGIYAEYGPAGSP